MVFSAGVEVLVKNLVFGDFLEKFFVFFGANDVEVESIEIGFVDAEYISYLFELYRVYEVDDFDQNPLKTRVDLEFGLEELFQLQKLEKSAHFLQFLLHN